MGLSDPTALKLSMASSSLFWDQAHGKPDSVEYNDNPESTRYYFEGLGQLSKRLRDPRESVSAGVIASILGCVCHDVTVANWDRWAVHLNGLHRISKLRGGFEGLENNIALIAFWLDIAGRTVLDSPPWFPIPREICTPEVEEVPPAMDRLLVGLDSVYPQLSPVLCALRMMSSVAQMVNRDSDSMPFWKNEVLGIHLIGPVTHRLLSIPRLSDDPTKESDPSVVGEMVRLSCLIVLSGVKKGFCLNSSDMVPLQAKFAEMAARSLGEIDSRLQDLRLWALVTSALLRPSDARLSLISHIQVHIVSQGLVDARAAVDIARALVWIEALEAHEETGLVAQVNGDDVCCF
ncbi:uncharacterized protein A1O5_00538 [Cladophialophora psammophila CBS 110553]|uniref:Transcription factor domain-containing protein n=1 Tax=Cladophialophora psammophila CBS 110553 TaxID=1182543 RepID=W9XFA8_9EURO|nr:uncharacterized protein A1O5_00538 [Cladophialophora psammophila CBS 110553]EXJ76030.1 hypothetical protein A1O5_00538 [Cladophialophora psammophila CBS 110553]